MDCKIDPNVEINQGGTLQQFIGSLIERLNLRQKLTKENTQKMQRGPNWEINPNLEIILEQILGKDGKTKFLAICEGCQLLKD
jgi:hypothetical protein